MQHASTLHQSQTPWKMSAPERIRMFLWRIGVNVRAKENMLRRLEVTDSKCVLRGEEVKITCHIFFSNALSPKLSGTQPVGVLGQMNFGSVPMRTLSIWS